MSLRRPIALVAAALVLFVSGIALASCGGGEDEAAPTTVTIIDTTTSIPPLTGTTTTTEPEPTGPTVIRIRVVNGAPQGGIVRETVRKNDQVVLVVRSDVADHVHLHGYDIMRDVGPGITARLPFRATIRGRFEVELEDRGVPIADITVR